MTISKTLMTGLLAASVLLGTAGASFAAQYAWIDHTTKLKSYHSNSSSTLDWLYEGQKVKVINDWGNWVKVKVYGQTGWVKEKALDYHNWNYNNYNNYNGVHACFSGPLGYVCVND